MKIELNIQSYLSDNLCDKGVDVMSNAGPSLALNYDLAESIDPRLVPIAAPKGTLYRYIPQSGPVEILVKQDEGATTNYVAVGGGGGEVNTASNVGAGSGLFKAKVGVDLQFKTLIAGSNVSFVVGADDITINANFTAGADRNLSNLLAPTAINADLLQTGGRSVGSTAQPWFKVIANEGHYTLIRNSLDTKTVINVDNSQLNATGLPFSGPVIDWNDGNVNVPSKPNDGNAPRELRLYQNTFYVAVKAPTLTGNTLFQLPNSNGSSGQILQTNGSGATSWVTAAFANQTLSNLTGFTDGSIPFVSGTGTALSQDNANFFWNNTTKRLGLGTTSPIRKIHIVSDDASISLGDGYNVDYYSNTAVNAVSFVGRRSRGTIAAPTAVQSGDNLLVIAANGYDGTSFQSGPTALISFVATENFTSTAVGTKFRVATVPNGSTIAARRVRFEVDQDGGLILYGNTSGNVKILPSATITSYSITLPNAQAVGDKGLRNDGSGNLSWSNRTIIESGATGARPASPVLGETFFDTTINKPIWYNGTNWVDATGTIA